MTWWWLVWLLGGIPSFYLLLLTWVAAPLPYPWLPEKARSSRAQGQTRFRIVIPAHNEAKHIATTVSAALALDYPRSHFSVLVVANACTDETAEVAQAAGAAVLSYAPPGKGGALDYAFNQLLHDPSWDAVLVLDADSVLDPHALTVLDACFQCGAEAVQLRYAVRNVRVNARTEIAAIQLASLNGVRPLARSRFGWSAGIFGNGFALARDTVAAVPYRAHGIVEDIEYHQHLFLAGKRVDFTDAAAVWAEMPVARHQLATQRARWERGKLWTIRHYAPQVLRQLLRRPWQTVGQLFDLLIPPIAWVAILLALLAWIAPQPVRIAALLGFGAILIHYLYAAHRYRLLPLFARALMHAPRYIFEKLWAVLHSMVTERRLGWKRTERD